MIAVFLQEQKKKKLSRTKKFTREKIGRRGAVTEKTDGESLLEGRRNSSRRRRRRRRRRSRDSVSRVEGYKGSACGGKEALEARRGRERGIQVR